MELIERKSWKPLIADRYYPTKRPHFVESIEVFGINTIRAKQTIYYYLSINKLNAKNDSLESLEMIIKILFQVY